jgi:serine/threonine-protein kinase
LEPEELDVEHLGRPAMQKVGDIGRFRLIAELARGGMGIVYLALLRGPGGFNKLFVVKELKRHLAEDPNLVRMFIDEARLAAKLNHPNVVQTIEVGSSGNRHYIAMEYLEGQSLKRLLRRACNEGTAVPLHYQLHVVMQMLEGLHYVHEATDFDGSPLNLVHRDVSPHNVFITYEGQVKVVDFGIAKAMGSTNNTRSGVLKGKVAYMAPEQSCGERVDRRADVFSAGVMLWEAAVNRRIWASLENDLQILRALMNGQIPSPRSAKPDIDPALERIIVQATAMKPDDRFQSVAELQSEIDGYLRGLDVPRFAGRDVGKHVSQVFAEERARIKQVIDGQLQLLRGVGSRDYATIDLPQLTTGGSPSSGTPSGLTRRGGTADQAVAQRAFRNVFDVTGDPGTLAPPMMGEPPPKPRRLVPAIVAIGVLSIGGTVLLLRKTATPHVAAPAASAASAQSAEPAPSASGAPSSSAPAPVPSIAVSVRVSPASARISLDNGPAQTGTFRGTLARDGGTHTLHVDAPQFQRKDVTFVADEDHAFDLSLPPVPPAVGWRPRAAAATSAPATVISSPPPNVAPTGTGRKKQPIDKNDPYTN